MSNQLNLVSKVKFLQKKFLSDVFDAPTLPEAMEAHGLYDLIAGAQLVVAHNASFDMGALQKAIQKYDMYQMPAFTYGCTVKLSRKLYPWLPNHRLNTMAEFLNVSFQHHDVAFGWDRLPIKQKSTLDTKSRVLSDCRQQG